MGYARCVVLGLLDGLRKAAGVSCVWEEVWDGRTIRRDDATVMRGSLFWGGKGGVCF